MKIRWMILLVLPLIALTMLMPIVLMLDDRGELIESFTSLFIILFVIIFAVMLVYSLYAGFRAAVVFDEKPKYGKKSADAPDCNPGHECPSCGAPLSDYSKNYCPNCGKQIDDRLIKY